MQANGETQLPALALEEVVVIAELHVLRLELGQQLESGCELESTNLKIASKNLLVATRDAQIRIRRVPWDRSGGLSDQELAPWG